MRRGDPRLHRDPSDRQRRELAAADARFDTPACPRGTEAGGAGVHRSRVDLSASMGPDAQLVTIALAQTPVSVEVPLNLRHIKAMMRKARAAGADLVQFTEGALSGYGRKVLTPFEQWRSEDW